MEKLEQEIQFLERSLQKLNERKALLEEVLEEKEARDFKEIKNITLIKEVEKRGSCFYPCNDFRSEMVLPRYHFEVETEGGKFHVMLEFTDTKHQSFSENFFIWHHVYELYLPKMNQVNTEKIVENMLAFLKENKAPLGNNHVLHIMHPFKPYYVKNDLSEFEKKRLPKEFKENPSVLHNLIEFYERTSLPLDVLTNEDKERKNDNIKRLMRELVFIKEDIQKLTKSMEHLLPFTKQKVTHDFNKVKRITPIKQDYLWGNYYDDLLNTPLESSTFFEVESEHETFLIALHWIGTKKQRVYESVFIYHSLYELHTVEMNQEHTEQIAEKMLSYVNEHDQNEHDPFPERSIVHVLHPFKRSYEEKVLTELEEKRFRKMKIIYEEMNEWSSF